MLPLQESSEPHLKAYAEASSQSFSLLQSSTAQRLVFVVGVLVLLWLAAYWALQ